MGEYDYESPDLEKDTQPAQPEQLGTAQLSQVQADDVSEEVEGVQTGGLRFVPNMDGTRQYTDQKPVETEDDPTPTPAEEPGEAQPVAEKTSEPVGH